MGCPSLQVWVREIAHVGRGLNRRDHDHELIHASVRVYACYWIADVLDSVVIPDASQTGVKGGDFQLRICGAIIY